VSAFLLDCIQHVYCCTCNMQGKSIHVALTFTFISCVKHARYMYDILTRVPICMHKIPRVHDEVLFFLCTNFYYYRFWHMNSSLWQMNLSCLQFKELFTTVVPEQSLVPTRFHVYCSCQSCNGWISAKVLNSIDKVTNSIAKTCQPSQNIKQFFKLYFIIIANLNWW